MNFYKYHGLGNSYIIVEAEALSAEKIIQICDPNFGIGSDGVLLADSHDSTDFALKIYNPDGSEAEKSGNGLRIFVAYLYEKGLVGMEPFTIFTAGGIVEATVLSVSGSETMVRVEMGQVVFEAAEELLSFGSEQLAVAIASVGNPHCVVFGRLDGDEISAEITKTLGPQIETHPRFPHKTNVQFLHPIDNHNILIEIWERGAGYTLASGSSSCAAAAVAVKHGFAQSPLTVHMPGGQLQIELTETYHATLTGPVQKIAEGQLQWLTFSQKPLRSPRLCGE